MASWLKRLGAGLSRSREKLSKLIPGNRAGEKLTDSEWQDIEDALIMADCGPELSINIVNKCKKERQDNLHQLKEHMLNVFPEVKSLNDDKKPFVLLVVGVNGTGKTTTIGKLATMYRQQGKKVLVGAADTFRAAAVEQLSVWVTRAGADIVKQAEGSDPAAVSFDTIQRGISRDYDVVIIDTAGRVQTDTSLMNELAKVHRVIQKAMPSAPHEVWHVVDAGTGQNAINQVEKFKEIAHTTGLIVTKLDGTAKGGIVLQLTHRFAIPIRYIGVGETLEDLLPFDASNFVDELLPKE
ncbi:MAG: signal recognition particle-docking protein FtsY [Mariprofundaceae bacterium]|nr:signal recognition particle-docking protein FtsY [Mariprofundaceae bacterium]